MCPCILRFWSLVFLDSVLEFMRGEGILCNAGGPCPALRLGTGRGHAHISVRGREVQGQVSCKHKVLSISES